MVSHLEQKIERNKHTHGRVIEVSGTVMDVEFPRDRFPIFLMNYMSLSLLKKIFLNTRQVSKLRSSWVMALFAALQLKIFLVFAGA